MDPEADEVPFTVDIGHVFTTTEVFGTRDDVIDWVREVGKANGVVVIILRSDKHTGKRGTKDKIMFGCQMSGKPRLIVKSVGCFSVKKFSKKRNCPFKLKAKYVSGSVGWKLTVRCGVHNHKLLTTSIGSSFFGRLTKAQRTVVHEHTKLKVAARDSMKALKEKFFGNVTSMDQLYKQRTMYRSKLRGPRTEMQELMRLIQAENYFCWSRKVEESDVVSDIMWAHPTSIKLFRLFPIVLFLDGTYKTNRYRIPLLEIVGVTSTERTFSIAFAYLSNERYENFRWALQNLRDLFEVDGLTPQVLMTDRDVGLMSAINVVFPTSVNLLCEWHVSKNVKAKCKQSVKKDRQDSVMELWYSLIDSRYEDEYSRRLYVLEQSCLDLPLFVNYINETWLIPHRQRFVLAWTNRVMHFGNHTTNRVERAHWSLKMTLGDSGGDLCKCWGAMNDMVNLQIAKIVETFQSSITRVEIEHNTPFYRKLRGVVSINALRHIAAEFARTNKGVGIDQNNCGCVIRATHGLPCAHELGIYHVSGVPIPLEAVHSHWTMLSLDGPYDDDIRNTNADCDITYSIEAILNRFAGMDLAEKFVYKKQIDELAFPSTTNMVPPPSKLKTKGAPKKRKQYDVRRDPSHWEHVDEAMKDTQDSVVKPSQRRSQDSSQRRSQQLSRRSQQDSTRMRLLHWIPQHFHPYVEDIVDVFGDGNCGYRAVAVGLGFGDDSWSLVRQDLIHELSAHHDFYANLFGPRLRVLRDSLFVDGLGYQGEDKWMSMPDMGYVISTRYNVAVVTLSLTGSYTFFPLRGSFSADKSINLICIVHVSGNHWVHVKMASNSPLPPIVPQWNLIAMDEADTWVTAYTGRLQLWSALAPQPAAFAHPVTVDIVDDSTYV